MVSMKEFTRQSASCFHKTLKTKVKSESPYGVLQLTTYLLHFGNTMSSLCCKNVVQYRIKVDNYEWEILIDFRIIIFCVHPGVSIKQITSPDH